jgi:hypothetical protein
MRYRLLFAGTLALLGCGQKSYSTPVSMQTSASPDQTYACVRKQLGELGYKQSSLDTPELRVTANKIDNKSRRPDVQFRRMVEKLEVDVAAGANGQTSIQVLGRTFGEYSTHRGPTEVEENASQQVKTDAQTLMERCRS